MARDLGADLQVVSITTDVRSHHTVAEACLDAGLHLLCEKPLALTLRACNRIVAAAARAGRIVSVAENYRRDPTNRLARALIQDGAIGNPRMMIRSNRVLGRPVMLDEVLSGAADTYQREIDAHLGLLVAASTL
jgi:predicted dehydrogenase